MTKSGVPLLGPFIKTDISFTPMVTGKRVESAFGLALWLFVAWQLAEMVLPSSAWLWQQLIRFGGSYLLPYLSEIRPHFEPIVPPR